MTVSNLGSPPAACASPLHPPFDLLGVLLEAFLQLAGVGGDPVPNIFYVLVHHGLQLGSVLPHLLPGFAHVLEEFVAHLLQVCAQALGGLLGVWHQLGLHVGLVNAQLSHALLDQGAAGGARRRSLGILLVDFCCFMMDWVRKQGVSFKIKT